MAVRKRGGVSAVHIRTICAVQCTTGPVCCLPPGRRVAVAAAPPAERAWRGRERQRRATPPGDARWLWCTRVPGEWGVLPAVRARRQTCARRGQADVPVSPPPPPLRTALPHPLLHSRQFLLVQAEASPLLSPSGARTPQRRMLLALAALAAAGTTPSRVLSVWLYTCGFQLLYAGAGCIGLGNPPQQCSL
jgi:hypothetical protein